VSSKITNRRIDLMLPGNKPLFGVCALLVIVQIAGGSHSDFDVYYTAVAQYFEGGWQRTYDPTALTPFKYHPFTVWLFAPFRLFPPTIAPAIWAVLNGYFLYQACRRFQSRFETSNLIPLLAILCVGHAWSWQLKFGNITCLMLWLFALFATNNSGWSRALTAAVLMLLKPFWVVLLPLGLLRKQYSAFGLTLAFVALGSLSILLVHPEKGLLAYELWQKTLADPTNAHNYPKNDNQCLYAGIYGLNTWGDQGKFWLWAILSGLFYVAALAFLPKSRRTHTFLALAILPPMLVAGPLTWIHHQILLIPVFMLLLAERKYWVVVLAALLLTGTGEIFVGRELFVELHQLRVPVLGYLVLMFGLWMNSGTEHAADRA